LGAFVFDDLAFPAAGRAFGNSLHLPKEGLTDLPYLSGTAHWLQVSVLPSALPLPSHLSQASLVPILIFFSVPVAISWSVERKLDLQVFPTV
jgi:hypothetical protein